MIASFLLFAESLFSGRLASAARQAHVVSLIFFVSMLLWPPLLRYWRRRRARARLPRVSFWKCACGHPNPPEAALCGKCAASYKPSWEERWAASPAARFLVRAGVFWRGAGWALYYLLPSIAFLLLDGARFGGGALRELFGALALAAASAAVVLAGVALGRSGGGPVARAAGLLAAGTLSSFMFLFAVLWAAAPYPPLKPLAALRLFPTGLVKMETPGGLKAEGPGRAQGELVEVRIRSAFLSWPLFHVRQTLPLDLQGRPLQKAWVIGLLDKGARRFPLDAPHLPRIALREDTLFQRPGGPYTLREASDGAGLVLEDPSQAAPQTP